ncbi:MAG: hypothetical protein HRT43_03720, partial [Campylobacteraceae bacterium]|nr:hypothetical protein [Campylobacteraceae bacterium]
MTEEINNDTLVDNLISEDILKSNNLIGAFRKIDRKDFVLLNGDDAYAIDKNLKIGYGQTLSEALVIA